jgi:hypothetical protein
MELPAGIAEVLPVTLMRWLGPVSTGDVVALRRFAWPDRIGPIELRRDRLWAVFLVVGSPWSRAPRTAGPGRSSARMTPSRLLFFRLGLAWLSQADARAAAIFVDELDAGGL